MLKRTHRWTIEAIITERMTLAEAAETAPDVVVLDLTVWKVPEDPLMLDTETTTSK